MFKRTFWIKKIEAAWKEKSIIWLSGVRRAGKTTLAQSLSNIDYFDCELPRVRQMLEDPEGFLDNASEKRIILDEIHRLPNPSEILKIAADHYPNIKILATGSSTLGASAKFRDTLTGRKKRIRLTPMILEDLDDFKKESLPHRFVRGGLPPFFLSPNLPESDFQDWIDSFWAKDVQELFRLERRNSFQRFTELIMAQSSGLFEATKFTAPCEVSRTTIMNYLKVLEATFVVSVIRPFSTHRPTEIIMAPRVYGFDTGFVCFYRGWTNLRQDDMGTLWEHFVLNELQAHLQSDRIHYWRTKQGHEVDFVILPRTRQKTPIPIECKWKAKRFQDRNLKVFSRHYPVLDYFVVASDVKRPFTRKSGSTNVHFINLHGLIDRITH